MGPILKTKHEIVIGNSNSMHQLKNNSVDMVITSPPYPMIEMWDELFIKFNNKIDEELKDGNGKNAFELMNFELEKIWSEVDRVMKPGGFVCINIGDATRTISKQFRLYSNHSEILRFFGKLDYDILPLIIWRKQTNKPNKFMGSGMLPSGAYVTLEHEYILIFRKSNKREFNTEEKEIRRRSSFFWEERNIWFSDIWFDLKGVGQNLKSKTFRKRSAAYPLALPLRLINMYSVQGDLILDPFLGTGTTTKAAMISGRNSVGYEIDPNFVKSEEGIHSNLKDIVDVNKALVKSRLIAHMNFVTKRLGSGKEIKHRSTFYDFPVMTTQEREMKFPIITGISREGNVYEFKHEFHKSMEDLTLKNWF